MNRFAFPIAALAWALAQPLAAAPQAAPAERLAALAERYYESQARLDPLYSATLAGDNRFDDRLPITIAPAERKKRFAMYRDVLRRLQEIDRARLAAAEATNYDLLAYQVRQRLALERFDDHLLPVDHLFATPIVLANFSSGQGEQPLATVAQHDAYLKRLARLPAWTAQAIANMRAGVRKGVVPPRAIVVAALPQIRALANEDLAANPFHAPVRNFPAGFPAAERARLAAAYGEIVGHRVVPSMRRLAQFLEREYLPACRETSGWGALPNGAEWYREWVRQHTTTDLDPEQIHALGLEEVARVHGELAKLAPRIGYEGDPRGLLAWARTEARFRPFKSDGEILDAYRAIDAKVRARLPQLFGRMPKAALDILPEPELTRATASDHYSVPAPDGSRPGIFWAVIPDPAKYGNTGMTALFLHEGQPGHHFQLALQQEMRLPKFRQYTFINAYGEGWALYAESLGKEMGLYDDPSAHAGLLWLDMMRAARLVVDTGLHAKGWTREQAIEYWRRNVGASEEKARNQVERYMAWPGQALGYKLGALKIRELRERAQRALGERFRLAAFHDEVLGEGGLPLALLEAKIDRWIAREKAR